MNLSDDIHLEKFKKAIKTLDLNKDEDTISSRYSDVNPFQPLTTAGFTKQNLGSFNSNLEPENLSSLFISNNKSN